MNGRGGGGSYPNINPPPPPNLKFLYFLISIFENRELSKNKTTLSYNYYHCYHNINETYILKIFCCKEP